MIYRHRVCKLSSNSHEFHSSSDSNSIKKNVCSVLCCTRFAYEWRINFINSGWVEWETSEKMSGKVMKIFLCHVIFIALFSASLSSHSTLLILFAHIFSLFFLLSIRSRTISLKKNIFFHHHIFHHIQLNKLVINLFRTVAEKLLCG